MKKVEEGEHQRDLHLSGLCLHREECLQSLTQAGRQDLGCPSEVTHPVGLQEIGALHLIEESNGLTGQLIGLILPKGILGCLCPAPGAQPAPERKSDKRKPRIPRDYEGKDEVWEDYLHHFLGVATWNEWTERDKARGLYIALKGPAADIVYNTPGAEDLSFQELCSLLEARYGVERRLTADKRALKKRTKQKGETYNALGDDISRLARRVYKDSPGLAEREGQGCLYPSPSHEPSVTCSSCQSSDSPGLYGGS